MKIDVIVPCHPKDYELLEICIEHIRKNVLDPIHKIYVITPDYIYPDSDDIVCVHENMFPFSRGDVLNILKFENKEDLVHWYYQQILKIYSMVILNVNDYVLVVDADTIFTNPVRFIDEHGTCSFGYNDSPIFTKYENHITTMFPHLECNKPSGVCDFQIWSKNVWKEILNNDEENFWKRFVECCSDVPQSASEYELYFQYYKSKYPYNLIDGKKIITNDLSKIYNVEKDVITVSLHSWLGKRDLKKPST